MYLLLTILELWLGNRLTKLQNKQFQGTEPSAAGGFLLSVAILVVSFCQFWALTRIFPLNLILILIVLLALGQSLYSVIGSITFLPPGKQHKISVMSVIWGANQPVPALIVLSLITVARLASLIGALWVFWTHPVGDPRAVVLIALFHFVLFQAVAIPAFIVTLWPMITSQYMDDDLRNVYLAQQFLQIYRATIYLLFPLWLLRAAIHTAFPHFPVPSDLPHFWILLSIPIFFFLAGGVLPFFIGTQRYRAQVKARVDWLEQWLRQALITSTLPTGDLKNRQVQDELGDLGDEIEPPHVREPAIAVLSRPDGGPDPGLECVASRR